MPIKEIKNYIKKYLNNLNPAAYLSQLKMQAAKSAQRGFTLIELLVVIAIIGLLASVVLVALNGARQKSRDAKRVADMNQFAKALELYFNENSSYPTMTASGPLSGLAVAVAGVPIIPKYLNKLPTPPTPNDGSCAATGSGSNDYYYFANSTGPSQSITGAYIITFCLGSQTGALPGGPHTLTQAGFQ